MTKAKEIIRKMESMHDEAQRNILMRFFKTGPGQYGEGDEFLGIRVPQTRMLVREYKSLPLGEVPQLLLSPWHEVRLCGLLILADKFERETRKNIFLGREETLRRDKILKMYLRYARQANNWDLVDLSAPNILGHWLLLPTNLKKSKLETMDNLAHSPNLWQQRISMVSTWKTTRSGDPSWCLRYAETHLGHTHDLMHKAVGWMLREVGKHAGLDLLRSFLQLHVHDMSRTTLRYAIEKMSENERKHWMSL